MKKNEPIIISNASPEEISLRSNFVQLFQQCPIPQIEILRNLILFIHRIDLTKVLFLNEVYQHFLNTHGVIMEFGVRWGANLSTLSSLRGIYEPFNYYRKIIGFDTFEGFTKVIDKDGKSEGMREGAYSVTANYEKYLEKILEYHEKESPISHIKKNFILKGNAPKRLEEYLAKHPETIIAFAYFDFDIYEPTRKCLALIKPHLTKGSVIGFDELNDPDFPGETLALKEVLGLDRFKIQRSRFSQNESFVIVQ